MHGISRRGRPTRAAVACLSVCAIVLLPAEAADAHSTPSTIVTSIEGVEPPAPAGVSFAVATSIAEELVATNTTDVALEVLSENNEPFLRLTSTKVEGNFANPDWWVTNDPLGALHVPDSAKAGATPRWVTVSTSGTWAWFDHRLHPVAIVVPRATVSAERDALLARWSVPMRLGQHALRVKGRVDYMPLRGGYQTSIDPPPAGMTAQLLQGRLPGIFATVAPGHRLVIQDVSRGDFARLGPGGAEVWSASETWIADQQARGTPTPGGPGRWIHVSDVASLTWLDPRLRPDSDRPAKAVMARNAPSTIKQWSVAVRVDGVPMQLHGAISWVPVKHGGDSAGATPFVLIGLGLVALVTGLALGLRLLRRRAV